MIFLVEKLSLSAKEICTVKERVVDAVTNRKWNEMSFLFYFVPEAAPRPRYSRFTKSFYVKGASSDIIFFDNYLNGLERPLEVIKTQCIFNCDAYIPIPNDMNRIEKVLSELRIIRPIATPDWDNIGKKYCDMIQSKILINDSIVVDGRARKFYSSKPRVEIHLSYLDEYDSSYNKRKVQSWKSYSTKK